MLTFPLCVEVEYFALLAPSVSVLGRDLGLVAGVRDEWAERVGLLVEVAFGAGGHHLAGRQPEVVPGVGDILVYGATGVTLGKKRENVQFSIAKLNIYDDS